MGNIPITHVYNVATIGADEILAKTLEDLLGRYIHTHHNRISLCPLKQDQLQRQVFQKVDGIILVVDSTETNQDTIQRTHDVLHRMLWDIPMNRRHCPIVLILDKFDSSNAKNEERIRKEVGFYRVLSWTISEIKDLRRNTMLNYLMNELQDLVLEYADHCGNGITLKWNPNLLKNANIGLIDKYFAKKTSKSANSESGDYQYKDYHNILEIICEFLPSQPYNDKSDQYLIAKSCASKRQKLTKTLHEFVELVKNRSPGTTSINI